MRLHISLDDDLVAELDARVGRRRRSAFIGELIRHALDEQRRWDTIEAGLGTVEPGEWAEDTATWVRQQRRSDPSRVG